MTTSILEDKPSLAVEVTDLIRRIRRHILNDNCQHCKHILKDEAGDRPAPSSTSAVNPLRHHSKQDGLNEYNKFE
jgi:hypothetical protein